MERAVGLRHAPAMASWPGARSARQQPSLRGDRQPHHGGAHPCHLLSLVLLAAIVATVAVLGQVAGPKDSFSAKLDPAPLLPFVV